MIPLKTLDRYLIQGFLAPLGITVSIFSVLVMLGKFFDKMEIFNNYHARPTDIAAYLVLGLPHWLNLVLPIATLLALLFSLGAFQQRGELTAARSAGITSMRLYMPFFATGMCLCILSLIGGLSIFPHFNFAARSIYRVKIKKGQAVSYRKDNIVAAGRNHQRFTIGWLDVAGNQMKDIVVDRFDDNLNWVQTVSAKEARFADNQWTFYNGVVRVHDPKNPELFLEENFTERVVDVKERPEDFAVEDKIPEDMTGREILKRIKRLKRQGVVAYKEKVAFQLKLALPFANLVVIGLGIPFALKSGQRGRTQTFSYALGMAFLYWGLTSVCQSLGEQGHIPAWVSAWMSNFVFGTVAAGLLVKNAL